MKKKLIITFAALVSLCASVNAQTSAVYAPDGIALKGYDAVAFFTLSKPVKGSVDYSYKWHNATWLFATKSGLDSFKGAPEKYAPQYGGYCAFGAAEGHKAPTQPETWTNVHNRLYFNYNEKVKESWMKNQAVLIDSADRKWPEIKDKE